MLYKKILHYIILIAYIYTTYILVIIVTTPAPGVTAGPPLPDFLQNQTSNHQQDSLGQFPPPPPPPPPKLDE